MTEVHECRPAAGEAVRVDLGEVAHLLARAADHADAIRDLGEVASDLLPNTTDEDQARAALLGQAALCEELARRLDAACGALARRPDDAYEHPATVEQLRTAFRLVDAVRSIGDAVVNLLPNSTDEDRAKAAIKGQSALCGELSDRLAMVRQSLGGVEE
jgi:hypothetical protein